jgi:hypothetical protein
MTRSVTRFKALSRHPRWLLALPAAALGVTPAAVTPPPAPPATAPAHTANPIPQGNGGDHDADNNGGPSDGDGNI